MFGIHITCSPINPLGCAPMGLKYLKLIACKALKQDFSSNNFSHNRLVIPYGLVTSPVGDASEIGEAASQ